MNYVDERKERRKGEWKEERYKAEGREETEEEGKNED